MQQFTEFRAESLARLKQSRAFHKLTTGAFSRKSYIGYLTNVYHYAQHSPQVISLAGSRALASHPGLATYLLRHASEEIGHEHWAFLDLLKLGVSKETIEASRPGTSCAAMIGMEYFVAGHWNPVAIFGWLFVLEAFGDDMGHLVAGQLDNSLKLGGEATYFLGGHGAADREHIQEIMKTIDRDMKNSRDVSDTLHIARVSRDLYLGILEESVRQVEKWL